MKTRILIIFLALLSTHSIAQLPSYVPTTDLIAWYSFDGNANDLSGNGFNATVSGATLATDHLGEADSAYFFDSTAYIEIPYNSAFNFTGSYSITFWVRDSLPTSATAGSDVNPALISRLYTGGPALSDSTTDNWTIFERGDLCKMQTAGNVAGSASVTTTATITNNAWHHIVYTVSGAPGTAICYKDGTQVNSNTYTAAITANTATIRIGLSNNSYWKGFTGYLDDIGFYSRVLTPCEVWTLYKGGADTTIGTIYGDSVLCTSSTLTFHDTTSSGGGLWSVSNTHATIVAATGSLTTVSSVTATPTFDTVIYTISNGCGTFATKYVVDIYPAAVAAFQTGASAGTKVCAPYGSITAALTTGTGGSTTGGIFTFSNADASGSATITSSGEAISIQGHYPGIDTVTYVVGTGCSTVTATHIFTVYPTSSAGTIVGDTAICVGAGTLTLSDSNGLSPGTWVSTNTSHATVGSSTGIVTPVGTTAAPVVIYYIFSNFCGTDTASRTVNVLAPLTTGFVPPTVFPICGHSSIGADSIALDVTTAGGVWTTYNSDAYVDSTGPYVYEVHGVSPGVDTLYYTLTNICGVTVTKRIQTIDYAPAAGTITGLSSVCLEDSISLSNDSTHGYWTVTNGHGTFDAAHKFTGVTVGIDTVAFTDTIHYGTLTCGNADTDIIKIITTPVHGTITNPTTLCVSTFEVLVDSGGTAGGTWSDKTGKVTITDSLLTAVTSGFDTIIYTVSSCGGTLYDTEVILINASPDPGGITGADSVCPAATIHLKDTGTASDGTWSILNSHASINSSGVVTGLTTGFDTVVYTITTAACGTSANKRKIFVNPDPTPGHIVAYGGAISLCTEDSLQMSDITATGGGTGRWSVTNGDLAVNPVTGGVYGVLGGTDTVVYTYTNVCASVDTFYKLTVNLLANAGTITGDDTTVCVGSTITLTDTTSGGSWFVSGADATISSGTVLGVHAGTVTASYEKITSECGTSIAHYVFVVIPLPDSGAIRGIKNECVGASETLYDTTAGGTGTWADINGHASISATGVVTGLSAGVDTIEYIYTNVCGTAIAKILDTVKALPDSGTISGTDSVCAGVSMTLTETSSLGSWSPSNSHASVSAAGVVTGVSAGVVTISYTAVTLTCGTQSAVFVMTVNPQPVAGTVTGTSVVCVNSTISLTDLSPGGVWISSNANATVSAAGVVTGVTAGTDIISYSVTNSCSTAVAPLTVTINPLPDSGIISGFSGGVCAFSYLTLSETMGTSAGTWRVTNANASITGLGIVHGITPGIDTVWYKYTNSCGTDSTFTPITINPLPDTGSISLSGIGSPTLCVGATLSLTETLPSGSGTWSDSLGFATVSPGGIVTGVFGGVDITNTDYIMYKVTNGCGTYAAHEKITVVPKPNADSITAPSPLCQGVIGDTIVDHAPGGITEWHSSNLAIATLTPAGAGVQFIYGAHVGTDTITFTYTNGCGTDTARKIINVSPQPVIDPISGPSGAYSLCSGTGSTILLADAAPGGVWSSSDINRATVLGGAVTAGDSGGTVIIMYTVTNSCNNIATSYTVAIAAGPDTGIISSAPSSVCASVTLSVPFSSTVAGGLWYSSNGNATVGGSSGILHGVSAGLDSIYYKVTNSCGSITSSPHVVTVKPYVDGGNIEPATFTELCKGDMKTLTDASPGGTWSVSNGNATINSLTGVITGVDTGVDIVRYTVINACGPFAPQKPFTVTTTPVITPVLGDTVVCLGTAILLSDSTSDGHWTLANGNALISSGIVTGVTPGTDTVIYSVETLCGTAEATYVITIRPEGFCNVAVHTVTTGEFKVYPNPSTGAFTIDIPQPYNTATIIVTDVLGKEVSTKAITNGNAAETTVDLGNLPAGNYIIKVNTENATYRQKVTLISQ